MTLQQLKYIVARNWVRPEKMPQMIFDMLEPYPCLAFEQGSDTSFYF